jgi:PTS system nitrogen regulatory IIA component
MDFGSTLKILRLASNVSIRTLAKTLSVSPAYLSQLENGKSPPSQKRIAQLERALSLPLGYLQQVATRSVDPNAEYLGAMPECIEFLDASRAAKMEAQDFTDLNEILLSDGLSWLRKTNRAWLREKRKSPASVKPHSSADTSLLHDFLEAKLILRFPKAKRKLALLSLLATKIAEQSENLDADEIYARLIAKDSETNTGVGGGVAIPHCFTSGIERTVVALALFPRGIHWGSVDNKPVHAVFLLVGEEQQRDLHVQLLARIAKLFSKPRFAEKLIKHAKPAEVIRFFEESARTIS